MASNWNAAESSAATSPSFGVGPNSNTNHDWRSHLPPDTRQQISNKIMDPLKKHLPVAPEDINRLKNTAAQFEEQSYSAVATMNDYLTKIDQKMMPLERKTQINPGQQPQQLTSQNQMLPQQQLAMHPKVHQQQHQQQIQMQISSALAGGSGMMSEAPAGGMLQSQLNSVQQEPVGRGASFQQQPLMWQQQQQPQQSQPMMQNPTRPMQQTNNVTDWQQRKLQLLKNQMQQFQMQQNQLQQNQMLNQKMMLGQKQNLLLGSGGAGNMNKMQRNAGLQQQPPQQQQHLLSQLQSQKELPQQQKLSMMQQREMQMPQRQMQGSPARLQMQDSNAIDTQRQQQQLGMMRQREMQMPQQQMQGPLALLQTQDRNAIYPQRQQQKQFIPQQQLQQQQRVPQDIASGSPPMDSASQTGHQGDWQEETYQRIKYLKDTYFPDLREVHGKLSIKLSELDSIVSLDATTQEKIEKMKHYKMGLERIMAVLQLSKHNMQIGLKDNLSLYEKQILSILQNHKKVSQQQFQDGARSDQLHFHAVQQSQPGLQSQQLKQQPQQINNQNQLQHLVSTSAMIQSNNLCMPNAMQQGKQNRLQLDQLQASGTGLGSLQKCTIGPTMQKTMNPPKVVGSAASISSSIMSHAVTKAGMQTNISSAQVLQPQQQHQEQQIQVPQRMMWTQKQTQQHYLSQGTMGPTMKNTTNLPQMVGSGAAISSSIVPHTVTVSGMRTNMSSSQVLKPEQEHQEQQIQPQQCLMQQKQQKQQKHQLVQKNQMQQLSEPNDLADLKSQQGASGMKSGSMFQHQYPGMGPRNGYYHSQLKPGSNPPISSPDQNIHSSSPQISHPTPQVDQPGIILPTQLKSGTTLQASASSFVPSPSPQVVSSPITEDTELGAGLMHNSAAGQTGQPLPTNSAQTGQMGQPQAESLAVGTPGISASPLSAEFTSPEAGRGTILSIQVPESETPIQKLVRLMRTMPRNQLNAAVKDIASVVSMVDRIPGSALGNGSQAAINDDLVAMTKCRFQAENLVHPEKRKPDPTDRVSPPTKRRKPDSTDQLAGRGFFSRIIKWKTVNPDEPCVII